MKTHWYIFGASNHPRRCPRFAVEATSEDEAKARIWRLYDDGYHRWEARITPRVMQTKDDLYGATMHPLPQ